MVNKKLLYFLPMICFICLMFISLNGQDTYLTTVDVTAQIDPYRIYENQPLHGTLSITHHIKDEIDANSFKIEGASLKADLIKNVKMPSQADVEVAIYQFELPGKPQGLYVLPEITVKVGGKEYQTIPATYEVSGIKAAPEASSMSSKATLKLESFVDAPPSTYPGHLLRIGYRYLFTGDIELTTEFLPLLDAKGFTKVGEKQVKDYVQNNVSVREVAQQVKAANPGQYTFSPGFVEGYAYVEKGPLKTRTYLSPKIKAEASETIITVNAYPPNKPATFNGAVGEFTFQTSLLTSPSVKVDEKMLLAIDIAGVADLYDVPLPPLKQSALKSLFRFSDLPPVGHIQNSTERYVVELYPLSTNIKEIPPIQFSYLEPLSGTYVTLESQPIPIQVTAAVPSPSEVILPPPPEENKPPVVNKHGLEPIEEKYFEKIEKIVPPPDIEKEKEKPVTTNVQKPGAVEISTIFLLTANDFTNLPFGTWKVFWIIPIGFILLGLQYWLMNFYKERSLVSKPVTSNDLFEKFKHASYGPEFFNLLNKAFILRLFELKEINSPAIIPEQLPSTGKSGDVRAFLTKIEQRRFTQASQLAEAEIRKEAENLFSKLK